MQSLTGYSLIFRMRYCGIKSPHGYTDFCVVFVSFNEMAENVSVLTMHLNVLTAPPCHVTAPGCPVAVNFYELTTDIYNVTVSFDLLTMNFYNVT